MHNMYISKESWLSTKKYVVREYLILKIKPCRFDSRIGDMEAESYNWYHLSVNI